MGPDPGNRDRTDPKLGSRWSVRCVSQPPQVKTISTGQSLADAVNRATGPGIAVRSARFTTSALCSGRIESGGEVAAPAAKCSGPGRLSATKGHRGEATHRGSRALIAQHDRGYLRPPLSPGSCGRCRRHQSCPRLGRPRSIGKLGVSLVQGRGILYVIRACAQFLPAHTPLPPVPDLTSAVSPA